MKDLDFDELDRAVSSLMGGVSKDAPVVAASSTEKVLTITPSEATPDSPVLAAVEQVDQSVSVQPAPAASSSRSPVTQSPLVAKRPNGRFMDMVRSSPTVAPSARPLPRQGVTVQPTTPTIVPEEPQLQAAEASSTAATSVSSTDWPDPIDMAQQERVEAPSEAETVEVHHLPDSEPLPVEEVASDLSDGEESPLQTPFLSDSKVEKRPLGAFNDMTTPVSNDATAATIATGTSPLEAAGDDEEDVQLAPDPTDVPVELPAELQNDVMAIEGDETRIDQPEVIAVTSHPREDPTPSQQSSEAVRPVMPVGMTSIAQQYRTEPSTSETEHAGIYDVEAYTQPLQHPVKKKSGWLWVLWIILLLALGSGGAAVLYYLDII